MKPTTRIEWLDLVRGLASIGVVIYHYRDYLQIKPGFFGFLAVDVFFVLSGIVLGMRYSDAIREGMTFRQFVGVRLRRLYPMVFIAGVMICVIALAIAPSGHAVEALDWHVWSVFVVWPSFDAAGGAAFPADAPLWSLWAELAANAIWFVILKFDRRWMLVLGLAAMAVTIGTAWHLSSADFGGGAGAISRFIGLARAFAWFGVGYAISQGVLQRLAQPKVLVLICCVTTAVAALTLRQNWLDQLLVVTTAAAMLQALCLSSPPGVRVAAFGRLIGMASYPLYLIHIPAKRLLPFVAGLPHWLGMLLVLLVLTVLATWINEALVHWIQRWRRRPRRLVACPDSVTS